MEEIVIECAYEPPHEHSYPADWQFAGANGLDPRADPRYRHSTYEYFDESLHLLHTTTVPLCDDEAIDKFTAVAGYGAGFFPVYLTVRRYGEKAAATLPWRYDKTTDMVVPL